MKTLLLFISCSIFTATYSQETLLLKPDGVVGRDACLFSNVAAGHNTTNYGVWNDFLASAWTHLGTESNVRALIQFDLSGIPAGAAITSAYLSLYYNPISVNTGHSTSSGTNACYIQRVTTTWDELTVTWDTQPSTTTVDQINVPQSSSTDQDYIDIDITALITYFYNNPTENFGMMLRLQNESYYRSLLFSSSDHPDPLLWPELEVNYTTNAGVSEIKKDFEVLINPNSPDQLFLSGELNNVSSITVSTLLGQNVFTTQTNFGDSKTETILLSQNSRGIYLITLKDKTGQTLKTEKLVLF